MRLMDTCRNTSVNMINKYFALRQVVDDCGKDSTQFLEGVKEIQELFFLEHKLYDEIKYPKNEIRLEQERNNKYMGKSSYYLELYKTRVLLKLKETEKMLGFAYLDAKDLGLSCDVIPINLKFSLEDAMCSCLEIEILKKIEVQMEEMSRIQCLDKEFISAVLSEHEDTKFHYLTNRTVSEVLALTANFDLKKIPNFSYSDFVAALKRKYGNKMDEQILDDGLKQMAMYTLSFLIPLKDMAESAISYYEYISYSTFFEVYLSYMSKERIREIDAELRDFSISDSTVRNGIKKILKQKRRNI